MGCLLSEAATWLMSSSEGIKSYRARRCLATENMAHVEAKGCFHDNKRVLHVVKEHHSVIREELIRRGDTLTPTVVDKLIAVMLRSSANNRPIALVAFNIADDIISRAAQRLEPSDNSLNSSYVPPIHTEVQAPETPGLTVRVASAECHQQTCRLFWQGILGLCQCSK